MIAHEHVGMDAPPRAPERLAQAPQKEFTIRVAAVDRLAPVAAVENVVKRPGVLDADSPRHGQCLRPRAPEYQEAQPDPYSYVYLDRQSQRHPCQSGSRQKKAPSQASVTLIAKHYTRNDAKTQLFQKHRFLLQEVEPVRRNRSNK